MMQLKKKSLILIAVKPEHKEAHNLSQEIASWLLAHDYNAQIIEAKTEQLELCTQQPNFIIVLGGDGTMLEVARYFIVAPVPIVGIKFGKVGFLTEITAKFWREGLNNLLNGEGQLLKRMALSCEIWRKGSLIYACNAVNDVVLNRGSLSRVISFNLFADEQEIGRVRADGLVISTPIGASGYAVSAGGPLVFPSLDSISITPISPFLSNFPPLVLPPHMNVGIVVNPGTAEAYLTVDGQVGFKLDQGDLISVKALPQAMHFVRIQKDTYFMRLRGRGFIQEYSSANGDGIF